MADDDVKELSLQDLYARMEDLARWRRLFRTFNKPLNDLPFTSTMRIISPTVCSLIINNESCENIVSKALVDHLKLPTDTKHVPYTIEWIKKGPSVKVTEICRVPLSLGKTYSDSVACDVVDMNTCHVLLGRSWQYNVDAKHAGKKNEYSFVWMNKKIILPPIPPSPKHPKDQKSKRISLCNKGEFLAELKELKQRFVLVMKEEVKILIEVPEKMKSLLKEFEVLIPEELTADLPPMRDIQHHIDFISGSVLPNLSHYRMNPQEKKILQDTIENLIKKCHIRESMSPYAVPTLLTLKKDGS
ncbi:uncharacterized protein LOC109823576 [Asparagus officinalis]|uniref:uncharacterized protein LOC109823576 n=1 Tax=Asparagus officinalis TaxID=4686 RepID=UPI00098E7AAB|nr:uncharacterized protein LOC109823576 [Asparagus officinalis]